MGIGERSPPGTPSYQLPPLGGDAGSIKCHHYREGFGAGLLVKLTLPLTRWVPARRVLFPVNVVFLLRASVARPGGAVNRALGRICSDLEQTGRVQNQADTV